MRTALKAAGLVAALVAVSFAGPADASRSSTFLQATLVGDGDPDGSGTAVLEFGRDKNLAFICHQIDVANVSRPITGGAITVGETGEIVGVLFVVLDQGGTLEGCSGQFAKNRDFNRILNDPGSHFLHLYNDEHPCDIVAVSVCPPGAVIGQLAPASSATG